MRLLWLLATAGCSFQIGDGRATSDGAPDDTRRDASTGDARTSDWWDPAWSHRLPLEIASTQPLGLGFQIGIKHDLDGADSPCAGSRDQVRVVRNHTTEVPRVIDELGGDEWIWFRLSAPLAAGASGPSEYWLYCGNPAAGAAPSAPSDVFEMFDDFTGTIFQQWSTRGAIEIANGAVTLPDGAAIHSTRTFSPGTATDFVLKASPQALADPWFWGGFEVGFTTTPPWVIWHAEDPNQIKQEAAVASTETAMGQRTLDANPHLYGIEHYGTSARFRHDNEPVGTIAYGGTIGQQLNVRFDNWDSPGPIEIHMVRVRQAIEPVPSITVEVAETRP